jgi:hypothetical protein
MRRMCDRLKAVKANREKQTEKREDTSNKGYLNFGWRSSRSISIHHFPILVNQELSKVPFDIVAKQPSSLL